jgi:hypothetical protein
MDALMLFRMVSDATFEADSIPDVCVLIADHFRQLAAAGLAKDAGLEALHIMSGRIDIAPTDTIPED